ncbi:MAG: DEAD/DEAH box helicase [Treponema sp.]|jgi:superfamily II DNA/RNA helicase|nr:DEAD/DEAH box helicase [Treponema sp.]
MADSSFAALDLRPYFSARLGDRNIHRPTDIQRKVIPELLAGRPVIFRSATGTGKTFAYLIPLLQRLWLNPPPKGSGPALLILSPTYELCAQIRNEAEFLLAEGRGGGKSDGAGEGKNEGEAGGTEAAVPDGGPPPFFPRKVSLLTGAGNLSRQIDALKRDRPLAAVGNPGRILLLSKMGKLKLGNLRSLVFDEGDRLMAEDLRGETLELWEHIARAAKAGRGPKAGDGPGAGEGPDAGTAAGPPNLNPNPNESGLLCAACSATLAVKEQDPLFRLMGGGVRIIETAEQEILRERIQHWAIWSEGRRKIDTLRSFLAAVKPKKALVFTGRSWDAAKIVARLGHLPAAALYGGMDKNRRRDAVAGFRSGKITVLASSDLAARGLDIPGITHVIALDVPDEESYIHRAGRTGRAGKRGIMVSIGDGEEMRLLARLEKRLGLTVYPKELYRGRLGAPVGDGE